MKIFSLIYIYIMYPYLALLIIFSNNCPGLIICVIPLFTKKIRLVKVGICLNIALKSNDLHLT